MELAKDGLDALSYVQTLADDDSAALPVLILLDLNLPKISGIDVLKQLRNSSRAGRIPVIVVTSSSAEVDRTAVQDLGADAYFQKPADLRSYMKLSEIVREVLK